MIVADTHAWVWWLAEDARLSETARESLESAQAVGVAAVSCWEFAWLAATERIRLAVEPIEWMQRAFCLPGLELVPLTPEIAARGAALGREFPRDPADRQIVATAIQLGARLVTRDGPITRSGLVQTIW